MSKIMMRDDDVTSLKSFDLRKPGHCYNIFTNHLELVSTATSPKGKRQEKTQGEVFIATARLSKKWAHATPRHKSHWDTLGDSHKIDGDRHHHTKHKHIRLSGQQASESKEQFTNQVIYSQTSTKISY